MSRPRLRITILEELPGIAHHRRTRRCIEVLQDGEVTRYAVPAAGPTDAIGLAHPKSPRVVALITLRRLGPTEFDKAWRKHGGVLPPIGAATSRPERRRKR